MKEIIKRNSLKNWLIRNIDNPLADLILSVVAFCESWLFSMPLDPFLAGLSALKPKKWVKYASLVTIFSVLGGLFGYFVGFLFFEIIGQPIVEFYNLHDQLQKLGESFANHTFITVFLAAFTPVPYQIFTISSGLFKVNLVLFFIASLIGRGMRFFFVAFIFSFVGKKFGEKILKYFNWLLLIFATIIFAFLFLK
jgi:membrane protein YqaA with SNARE-associated domain